MSEVAAAPPLRVLIIGYVWPEPRSSAAGGHMLQILECFAAQGWQLTFASPAAVGEHTADLGALGIAQCSIELNHSSFDTFVRNLDPHIVLFDRFMMEEQFGWRVEKHCPNALRVLETSDLQSLRDARQALLKAMLKADPEQQDFTELFALPLAQLFQSMALSDTAQREIAAIYRCDLSLMISTLEIDLLTQAFGLPAALLCHCPLMIDAVPSPWLDFDQRAHFLSIGNFRHAPNWDAVLWLKTHLWPLIRQRLPQAQLHIYGAYTPPKATALHNPSQGFLIKNWAEDALQVMSQARVCLAPIRFGAGIKGKLLDAMLSGTPSVTTPIGSEAMAYDQPWPGAVASTAQTLADAAVGLYSDATQWHAAQSHIQAILPAHYSRINIAPILIQRLRDTLQSLPELRRANFTGSMLRHHHHQSTRYMAQWIEAKNRSNTNSQD